MNDTLKLPVGIDDFKKIREAGFYYVDKTKLIEQLLQSWGEVTLFTRPRRFGKTLNMSMLKSFFEIGAEKSLFQGLYISEKEKLCAEYMGKYPVIFLSLKGVEGLHFADAQKMLMTIINNEVRRHYYLKTSDKLTVEDRKQFEKMLLNEDVNLVDSLRLLSQLLYLHYDQKVVILIDEYDVPLDKAFKNGYYQEMVSLIRGLFGQALKTNEFLQFAVLTGCLRVSKESIFTGLNNFEINSIVDIEHEEGFGFTDAEVMQMLKYYHCTERYSDIKEWYDGYHFGNADIYCPWDVINFVKKLLTDSNAKPSAFWINSSGNDLVKLFVDKADQSTKDEIERLVTGKSVTKRIRLDLTYDEIENSIDNVWSVLFTTGYLTNIGNPESGVYELVIPNREVHEVFVLQIQEWFQRSVAKEESMPEFSKTILNADAEELQKQLNVIMSRMISVLDTKAREEQKENFYHGLLLGLLRGSNPDWLIKSNRESGDGYSDILIEPENPDAGIIIEVKHAASISGLDKACENAMAQIKNRRYDETLRENGRCDILAYGIAFHKKRCRVVCERL
ncbi:hypothetical protein ROSEINA2194_01909 [Roseburia inulinivorans DSM 16841]|uniref:AAA-ATPase-like domain-containing protein n=1 Tax=Roseburia inulinivorans DSM 16841 TaxID=622312 RepID=C0FT42_9FIRM|nr:AAA family ATPase [Roseburia inulinivorans]EEG94271.1 hypothetical protein ROSEINA2194_01909 [Roseburia inulinivorans DSM 16841]MCC3343072.1 ATP-binding protein [Roseburia inulinivorans DSM 16841]